MAHESGEEVRQEKLIRGKYYKIVSVVAVPVLTYIGEFDHIFEMGNVEFVAFADLNRLFNGQNVRTFRTLGLNGQVQWRYYETPQFSQPGGRRRIKRTRTNKRRTKQKKRRASKRRMH